MSGESRRPVVLDTNVISELARPQPNATVLGALQRVSDRTYLTSVTIGELWLGVHLLDDGRRRRELLHHVRAVQDAYSRRTLPLGSGSATLYAESVAELTRRGVTISVNDAYIAAITVTHDAVLYTRNLKDFEAYPGLEVVSPWGLTG